MSYHQQRVMRLFQRTGSITRQDLKKERYWFGPMKSLIEKGFVEEKVGVFYLTNLGCQYMIEVLEGK